MTARPPDPALDETCVEADPPRVKPGAISILLEKLASAPDTELPLLPFLGASVGRFDLLREIGRGGFGVVYEARDRELGRLVAIKVIRPGMRSTSELRQEWLRREAETAAQLSHPNIVTLHDVGSSESGPYLVLELLHGETLHTRLARGPLPAREAVAVVIDVARALAHAHGCGVLHRDLKPSNIFLTEQHGVKVLDFGLAHVFGATGPKGGGTPAYMAPEQWRGEPEDARADVFGIGVILFEVLTGKLPYRVSRDNSAVLEPGTAPSLPAAAAPPALAALVASAISRDPAGRPRDGRAMLDALVAVQRALDGPEPEAQRVAGGIRSWRRYDAKLWVLLAMALAAAAVLGIRATGRGARERIGVAVADFDNDTGQAELDGLSGLLITSLEQSHHLAVLPRARMLDALGQLGRDDVPRIDEPLGREIARRAEAEALLLGSVRRGDGAYRIALRAIDPVRGAQLFALEEEGVGQTAIPGMIDRLSERARRALRERDGDVRTSRVKLDEAITSSLEAYQHYLLSQTCMNRTAYGLDCAAELEKALAIDPTFALAHYQLAVWLSEHGGSRARQQQAIDAALRFIGRVPARDGQLIRAWKAHFEGDDEAALAAYRRMIDAYPTELQPLYEAGDLLHHRGEFATAATFFERLLELDPGHGWALDHWVQAAGALRRRRELRDRVQRWIGAPASQATLHALSIAYGWLGDYAAAAGAAQREVDAGGGLVAQEDLAYAELFAGAHAHLEQDLGPLIAPGSQAPMFGYYALAAADAYRGRRRSGLARFTELLRRVGEGDALFHSLRASYLVGDGDARLVWADVSRVRELDPLAASAHAVSLAYLGDLQHAAELAAYLRPGSSRRQTYDALVRWQRGERDAARRALGEIAARAPFDVDLGIAPAYLHGELAARAGEDREAVEALRSFRSLYIPTMMWRSWAAPRSLYLEAASLERLGRRAEALARVDEMLAAWHEADPELSLAREARALRSRLAAAAPAPE